MDIQLIANGETKTDRFFRKWGVSYLINGKVLFDTFGLPWYYRYRLAACRTDLSKIEHVVFSHDHWDHTDAYWPLAGKLRHAPVHICAGFADEMVTKLVFTGARLKVWKESAEIAPGIHTTGPVEGRFAGRAIWEQALVLKSPAGLTVVTGCAHPTIVRVLETVERDFQAPVKAVIGGLHMKDETEDNLAAVAEVFNALPVERIIPLHCTGEAAVRTFTRMCRAQVIRMTPGETVSI